MPSQAVSDALQAVQQLPGRPKAWREVAAALKEIPGPEARADIWRAALARWTSLGPAEVAEAFGADLAARLFRHLGEMVRYIDPADATAVNAAWRLAGRLYADPAFGELGARHPELFAEFVRLSGQDPYMKSAERHGADVSPCVLDAIAVHAVEPGSGALEGLCRAEMAAGHGGLAEVSERARRLLDDPEFLRPVVICGFHHSGTRLLARQLAALGVRQRINLYQYEWTYVVQLNSILEPGCMDPGRLGSGGEAASLVQPHRLAFRMALAGLQPGEPWGFKDPRNGLAAEAWLKAFPEARVVHLLRDPVATIGTLPELYDRFVRLDARRPTRTRFWMDLWQAYVDGARRGMASAAAAVEIRFEDLCADPVGVLGEVCGALDLPAEVGPEILTEAPIQSGKTEVRDQVRAALDAADFLALAAFAGRYGY